MLITEQAPQRATLPQVPHQHAAAGTEVAAGKSSSGQDGAGSLSIRKGVGLAALRAVHAGPCRLPVLTPGWPSTSWGGRSSPQLPCCPLSSQHFVCAKCEKPFLGHRHYEKKGLAYCETHYNQVGPGGRQWTGRACEARGQGAAGGSGGLQGGEVA